MTNQKTLPTTPLARTGIMAIVGFLAFSEIVSGFLQSWYAPVLSMLGERLDTNAAQLNWVSASYLLASVVFVPLLAKLGDLYGHKKMVLIVLTTVVVGTIVTAVATTFPMFVLGRVIQGALGALLPLEMAIIRERSGDRAASGIGILVGCLGAGAAIGTLLVGFLGTFLPLAAILLVPGALTLLALVLIALTVPETTIRSQGSIDWKGATLLGLGLALTLFAVSNGRAYGWTSPLIIFLILVGIAACIAFVRVERRVKSPLVDIDLVTRGGVGFFLLLMLLFGAQFYGSGSVNSLFAAAKPDTAGYGFGLDSLGVSLTLLPSSAMLMVGAFIGAPLVRRFGQARVLWVSNLLVVAKYVMVMLFNDNLSVFFAAQFVGGFGIGIFVAIMPAIVVGLAPKDSSGIAGAMYNTSRTLSGALGGALFAGVMSAMFLPGTSVPSLGAFLTVWAICGGLSVVIMVILPLGRKITARAESPAEPTLKTSEVH
ncbi:MFS transporter [Arthrobacter ginkgonis]|uniref:MFS transporter n=1 Tax=Arthrobacter ginkgonis TaxID=1630594 RepID=A0ABP7DBI9_9MICC